MRIVELRCEAEFANLRTEWDALLAASESDTIFLTWEWLSAWWTAYGTPGDLRILLAYDDANTLRGFAPLRAQSIRKYGQSFSALTFVGDGSNDSDYLDFIVRAGDEAAVMEAFAKHLEPELARGTLLQLHEIPDSSPNLAFLRALGQRKGMVASEADSPCATVTLPGTWQEYLAQLAPRFRTKIRSVLRNLEGRADVQFRFCERCEEFARLLPVLYDLHHRRWARQSKPGVFQWDKKRVFYGELSPLLLDRGQLAFSWLEWKGQILACQYGFVYRDVYSQLQEGYEPDCEHLNPGVGLRAWTIQEFLKRGVKEYDFLGGVGRHKSDWGSHTKLSKRLVLGRAQARNILYCRGPLWESQAREWVKQRVPEKMLAAREARQQRRTVEPAASSRMRNALASFYFHSPLPSLVPAIRNRYQLTISANGHGRKLGLQKRQEASARILYFHRVDEKADPFIGSISTALFEREMQYVAQHYCVVCLGEVVERLRNGGPPEPVVAITFDDGYQDNYSNAFPILQRYGLPATIFLTTGGIDTRQRLWFEQLSLAMKRTSQTFIDLEIGVPRRFWMRTDAERFQSKNQIIALVQQLPDTELRRWIADILAQLGVEPDTEDTMLTWDQIRLMKQHRIDFGGHTVTHPFVSKLDPQQAVFEASECKRRIEEETQSPVEHFAYPNGRQGDFEAWNKQVLREAGYQAAVSTLWGVNYPSTDPMELKRGQPWEENPAVFAAKLDWYQCVDS